MAFACRAEQSVPVFGDAVALQGGRVLVDGSDLAALRRDAVARLVSYVPQAHAAFFPFTVRDVVLMGRTAHLGPFASPGKRDEEAAMAALERMRIARLADAIYTRISGGERQLTLIARALAIDPTAPARVYAGTGGGVFRTVNGAASWTFPSIGLPAAATTVVYAGAFGAGVFKSTSAGASWTRFTKSARRWPPRWMSTRPSARRSTTSSTPSTGGALSWWSPTVKARSMACAPWVSRRPNSSACILKQAKALLAACFPAACPPAAMPTAPRAARTPWPSSSSRTISGSCRRCATA